MRGLEQSFGDVRRLWACPEPGEDRWGEDRWDEEDPDDWLDAWTTELVDRSHESGTAGGGPLGPPGSC